MVIDRHASGLGVLFEIRLEAPRTLLGLSPDEAAVELTHRAVAEGSFQLFARGVGAENTTMPPVL